MPNGKPGDHPITDIIIHKMRLFSPKADALIAEIVSLGGREELEKRFDWFLPPPVKELEARLAALRNELKTP